MLTASQRLLVSGAQHWCALFPGLLVALLIAVAGQFIAEHYGAPAMLMALLFGIALNFLAHDSKCAAGIAFGSKTVLRFGVALLGLRINFELAARIGWESLILIVVAIVATIAFGLLGARFLRHNKSFGFLTAGSVAICGVSAAMAINSILPQDRQSDQRLVFTVVGVTLLSTIAMIAYPILTAVLGFSEHSAGVFLGATIHDVAQVVGAGFSISDTSGEVATFVKLMRVAMLAPVILFASLAIRHYYAHSSDKRSAAPLLPAFVIAFAALAIINSLHLVPAQLSELSNALSRWALLTAIAAVGMKTSIQQILRVGLPAIALIVAETIFLALLVLLALSLYL